MADQPESPEIRIIVEGAIGTIIIDNAPRKNAVTLAMWQALPDAVASLDADAEVRVIVVTGAGGAAFSAGADISEFAEVRKDGPSARRYDLANAEGFRTIRRACKPTIARIAGPCIGGGLGIALACDLRVASANAVFGIPAAKLGLGYPPDCMVDLVSAIGPSRAKELFFTARRVTAEEALAIGLVGQVVPDADLIDRVAGLAEEIAANAPMTVQAAKCAIDRLAHDPSSTSLAHATKLADACYDSADFIEGRAAFLEKRAAVFRGH